MPLKVILCYTKCSICCEPKWPYWGAQVVAHCGYLGRQRVNYTELEQTHRLYTRRVRMQGGTAQRNVHSMIVESVDPAEFGSSVVPCAGGLPQPANLEPRPGVRGGWVAGWWKHHNNATTFRGIARTKQHTGRGKKVIAASFQRTAVIRPSLPSAFSLLPQNFCPLLGCIRFFGSFETLASISCPNIAWVR